MTAGPARTGGTSDDCSVCREVGGPHGVPDKTQAILTARCDNLIEPDGTPCPGLLRYRWGQIEAACDTCGGRCGIAVASWTAVVPDGAS